MDDTTALLQQLADCSKDGEVDDEGNEYILENDDAVWLLHEFISRAREILGEPVDRHEEAE